MNTTVSSRRGKKFQVSLNPDRTRVFRRLAGAIIVALDILCPPAPAQQITVNRIEMMPNAPSPYLMRNWKQVAASYDSMAFNLNLTGQYLPLCWLNTNPINYTNHSSFGLNTVVGTTAPTSAEAINCLPAVNGACLTGIDKTNQNGYNWVLMCEEWFNRKNGQNLYLNHPDSQTGDDWWYETMPNVFFYELYGRYPGTGDFQNQFTTVADRWLTAAAAMGGKTTPWNVPSMDHRAWDFSTMTANDAAVHEPEAAGAIAWLLYHAYGRTLNPSYRIGAEWALEFLNGLSTNPSYELQLSYGTYIAARMNAELGTTYDLAKMVNWCFDVGPLRSWGSIVGNWGGYDCSGLIGEVNGSNDYAFIMNTFEQVGALVPMVRYDDRFARAIGKWVLNAANASRLFYPNYLPDLNQDSRNWSRQYDPESTIAHEAMRQYNGSVSPYATGDAISGGWGATNLALYGSSHVGILAAIIDSTNVPMILRLDVLKTDYFHDTAYPTYLYYNPYTMTQSVEIDVGTGQHDLYDEVSNSFLLTGVTGKTSLTVPADAAVLAVIAPAGGTQTFILDRMLINGVTVDYRSGHTVPNYPPRIKSIAADSTTLLMGKTVQMYCTATDRDNDPLSYTWIASLGTVTGSGPTVTWKAPDSVTNPLVMCVVDDGHGAQDTARVTFSVVLSINHPPVISHFVARPRKIDLNAKSQITCVASDPDGNTLSYTWSSVSGVLTGNGLTVSWTAPAVAGNYYIRCVVDDGHGGQAADSIGLEVRDFSVVQTGQMVAYYPFSGNANDSSAFGNNGTVYGAHLVSDRFGRLNSAYSFDSNLGDYIDVPNNTSINFQQSITVNFWMKVGAFFDREAYPISHGNWTNRWKVSITNKHLRWTLKTTAGIKDLDSETQLVLDSLYNVTVVYSGSDFEIYLNGELDAFSSWSGPILQTSIDLTIGQVLPTDKNYNFTGVLDDIRIYNYALSTATIASLYDVSTSVGSSGQELVPHEMTLSQNFPNPFNPTTTIRFSIPAETSLYHGSTVSLRIYDVLGREVATLVNREMKPGWYSVVWDASNVASGVYYARLQTELGSRVNKMVLMK